MVKEAMFCGREQFGGMAHVHPFTYRGAYLMNTFCDFIASCAGTCGCLTMWYIDADGDES